MSYYDRLLGLCKYTGFYLTNEQYGGWTATCEKGATTCQYVPAEKVIELAKKAGMKIHLAGPVWREIGKSGWGELVSPQEAEILISQLKKARSSGSIHSSSSSYKTPEEIVRGFIEGVER